MRQDSTGLIEAFEMKQVNERTGNISFKKACAFGWERIVLAGHKLLIITDEGGVFRAEHVLHDKDEKAFPDGTRGYVFTPENPVYQL